MLYLLSSLLLSVDLEHIVINRITFIIMLNQNMFMTQDTLDCRWRNSADILICVWFICWAFRDGELHHCSHDYNTLITDNDICDPLDDDGDIPAEVCGDELETVAGTWRWVAQDWLPLLPQLVTSSLRSLQRPSRGPQPITARHAEPVTNQRRAGGCWRLLSPGLSQARASPRSQPLCACTREHQGYPEYTLILHTDI